MNHLELENLKEHTQQLEKDLEYIDKSIVIPIKDKIARNKEKIHEIITPKLI